MRARLVARLARAFAVGVPPLVLVAGAGAVVAAVALGAARSLWLAMFVALSWLVAPLASAAWKLRPRREAPTGLAVGEAAEPELWAIVRTACREAQRPLPDHVRITTGETLEQRGGDLCVGLAWLGGASERDLEIGIARAVVGAAVSRQRLDDDVLANLDRVARVGVVGLPWRAVAHAGRALMSLARRLRADVVGESCVATYGRNATVAFIRAEQERAQWVDYWAEDVGPCLDSGFAPPILEGWRERLAAGGVGLVPLDGVIRTPERVLEARLLTTLSGDRAGELLPIAWAAAAEAVQLSLEARAAEPVPTAVPPGREAVVALAMDARARRRMLADVTVIAVLVAAVTVFFGAMAPMAPTIAGAAVCVAIAGTTLAVGLRWTRPRMRAALRGGRLAVAADAMRIEYPGLMREPLVIPRSAVRLATVDDGARDDRRFSFAANEEVFAGLDTDDEWLWVRDGVNLLPHLAVRATEAPNVAIVLREAMPAPRMRGDGEHLPLRGEAMAGLTLRAADAAAARSALSSWGLTRRATVDDAVLLAEAFRGA